MTNKLPVVGKRYKLRNQFGKGNGEIVTVVSVDKDFSCKLYLEKRGGVCSDPLPLASFCNICEELPEDSLQEKEEAQEDTSKDFNAKALKAKATALWNDFRFKKDYRFEEPADNEPKVNGTHNPVDLEKEKVNIKEATILNALRQQVIENFKKTQNPWLPMSCAPKCGSPITVKQSTNERHKIFKANWFLNKWYSLYEEGGNEEVYPEFWLEGSKEEPKIDMKEERVETVSIWKDVSKLPFGCEDVVVKFNNGESMFGYCRNRKVFSGLIDDGGDFYVTEITTEGSKFCFLSDFINSFEQMQKDVEKLKKKL